MKTHHPFSPSQLQSLEACPAYQGTNSESEAATRGTKLHTVAERAQDDNSLSDEDVADASAAMQFAEHQKALLGENVLDLRETYLPVDDEVIYVPDTVGDHGEIGFVGTTAGTADRVLISGDGRRAILIDHKFGKWAVEPAINNRQSDAYALGVFFAYPTVESVQVHFFQPAVEGENNHVWKRAEVPELLLRVKTIVARAKAARQAGDFLTANPTTPTCLFCRHLAVCPAVAAKVIKIAKKFSPLEVDALDLTPTKVHEPEHAAAGMRLAGIVDAWSKAFKSLVTDRALRGGPIPVGYELTSRATREVVNAERFREVTMAFISDTEYASLMSPPAITAIEKLVSDKSPRGQKTQNLAAWKTATEDAGAVQKRPAYAFLKAKTE